MKLSLLRNSTAGPGCAVDASSFLQRAAVQSLATGLDRHLRSPITGGPATCRDFLEGDRRGAANRVTLPQKGGRFGKRPKQSYPACYTFKRTSEL